MRRVSEYSNSRSATSFWGFSMCGPIWWNTLIQRLELISMRFERPSLAPSRRGTSCLRILAKEVPCECNRLNQSIERMRGTGRRPGRS